MLIRKIGHLSTLVLPKDALSKSNMAPKDAVKVTTVSTPNKMVITLDKVV
jgi:hypothetical protein